MPQHQAGQPQAAPEQQSSSLEFGITMTQGLPAATQPLLQVGSNKIKGSHNFIITCMAQHNKTAAGCWVDAWLAHVMRPSAVISCIGNQLWLRIR
jgi:hypothetical protein